MTLGAGDTVLCSGTLRAGYLLPGAAGRGRRPAASPASLWGRDYQVARDEGLSDRDIRLLLADHGLSVAELDPAWWWLPGASEIHIPPEHDQERIFRFTEPELFAVADAVGARSLNAVDVFGGRGPSTRRRRPSPGCATGRPSTACSSTWSSCRGRASPTWRRPGRSSVRPTGPTAGSCSTPGTTSAASPTARCCAPSRARPSSGVQLCDAPAAAEAESAPRHAARTAAAGRRASWRLATLLADLRATGTAAPLGVEVFSDVLHALAPEEAGRLAGALVADVAFLRSGLRSRRRSRGSRRPAQPTPLRGRRGWCPPPW